MKTTNKRPLGRVVAALAGASLLVTAAACGPAATKDDASGYPSKTVKIMVPAAPGGGWDLTGRNMQQVIQKDKIVDADVEVFNRDGGGGATGLSQLISKEKGDPYQLMIAGLVMIGALEQAKSPLELSQAEAIATLTSETEALVVKSDSKFKTVDDVVDAYKKDPKSVTFGGGSQGGSDHIVAGLLLQAADLEAKDMKYIGYAGGGEATAGILSGDVEVGISGVSEFEGQIEAGKMRLLAITSDEKRDVGGKAAPTLKDAGYDVDFVNWRAIFAPPGISDAERKSIIKMVDDVHKSTGWKGVLKEQGWTDDYRTGDDAQKFVESESKRIEGVLKDLGI